MEDEFSVVNRRVCRLCLAPETECVPIFTTSAADKEPLFNKILTCVSIKIHEKDRLSSRICHACISYLNSWQSFKNRCQNAQKKQKNWLVLITEKERQIQASRIAQQRSQMQKNLASYENFVKTQQQVPKTNRPDVNTFGELSKNGVEVSIIKQEPIDIDDNINQDSLKMDIDPTQFLARGDDDDVGYQHDDEDEYQDAIPPLVQLMEEGPPILTSLGLTHINHVNPYSYLSTEHELPDDSLTEDDSMMYNSGNLSINPQRRRLAPVPACCSICEMKFSNRANARRHERNIHGVILNPIALTPTSQLIGHQSTPTQPSQPRPPAPRKIIVVPEVFDYNDPRKYRALITEHKLQFIHKTSDFLDQYQQMTCTCCDRIFATYKAFMSHMRKKYDHLPRNLCFKCLKQFETKGQFIAHLKKKNCINLYKIYLSDDSIEKLPPPSKSNSESGRIGTKEILANKEYGCKLCTRTFRLKMDFRNHVYIAHAEEQKTKDVPGSACGFCNAEFDDAVLRRRHYNNLECIIFIICGTCDEKLENNTQFIDHVYTAHLNNPSAVNTYVKSELLDESGFSDESKFDPSSLSPLRTPQNCPVCGKQYNNYYNVLRHMEVKHPDQLPNTYQCEICLIGFPRQSELREHMKALHPDTLIKTPQKMTFTCKECGVVKETKEEWIDHMMSHSNYVCQQCDYRTQNKTEFDLHLATHLSPQLKMKVFSCTHCSHSFNTGKGLEEHLATVHLNEVAKNENEIKPDDESQLCDNEDSNARDGMEMEDVTNGGGDLSHLSISISGTTTPTLGPQKQRECPICKAIFNIGVAFSNHMRTHMVGAANSSSSTPIASTSTAGTTSTPATAVAGIYKQATPRIRCRICQKRINTKLGLKRHMLMAHQIKNYTSIKCYLCPAEFNSHKGLRVHLHRTHQVAKDEEELVRMLPKDAGVVPPAAKRMRPIAPALAPAIFECDICYTVYRNRQDLRDHNTAVHGFNNDDTVDNDGIDNYLEEEAIQLPPPIDMWYQCRYCNDTFNSSKKLTIHMNLHEEHDQTDHSCKDCGNVYMNKKSLWVHRYKKHPRPPTPSPCPICSKVFFDQIELNYHAKTHTDLNELDLMMQPDEPPLPPVDQSEGQYACRVCDQKFHDKGPLSKHLRIHEMENNMFTNPSMAEAFDLGVAEMSGMEYKMPYQNTIVNGEFACDLCPKTFPILNALHVHRGWHFRSPSGRQVTDPAQMWQPGSIPPSKLRRMKNPYGSPPICPFCNSTFASTNNLRRHIVEVHKRNEAKQQRETDPENPDIFIEKVKECLACSISFQTTSEWIDHKIMHARNAKPSSTFEWACEICGKMFTRKERLLQHMITHLNSKEFDEHGNLNPNYENSMDISQEGSEKNFESNSQSSMSSAYSTGVMMKQENVKMSDEIKIQNENIIDEEDDDEEEEEEEEEDEFDELQLEPEIYIEPELEIKSETVELACELCQKIFTNTKDLRRHVASHILNGGEAMSSPSSSPQPETTEQEMEQEHGEHQEHTEQEQTTSSSSSSSSSSEDEDDEGNENVMIVEVETKTDME